jgi:hypothetical protein
MPMRDLRRWAGGVDKSSVSFGLPTWTFFSARQYNPPIGGRVYKEGKQ